MTQQLKEIKILTELEKAIMSLVSEAGLDKDDFEDVEAYNADHFEEVLDSLEAVGILEFEEEFQEGGEGQGDYITIIYKIKIKGYTDTLIQFEGDYDSWNGTHWMDKNIVRKEVRMEPVTHYIAIK